MNSTCLYAKRVGAGDDSAAPPCLPNGYLVKIEIQTLLATYDGRLVVERKRAPLPDGSLQQLVDHSITKQVHRKDHERTPPVLSLSKPTKRKEKNERQTFEERCCELGVTRETGLRLLQNSKREGNSQDFWGTSKTEPAPEQRLETDTETLNRSSSLSQRKTRGNSAGLLEMRNALEREQRKLARKKRKEESKKACMVSSDEGGVCDSDEAIARQLQEDEKRLQMIQAQLSVVKEDAKDVARRWAEATPEEEDTADKPNQYSPDRTVPLPPLKTSKNPFFLRDKHLTRANLNKVPGVKMTKLVPSSSLKEAVKSEIPPKRKGERRVRSTRVGSKHVKRKAAAPINWPHDRDLERMLHGKRKDIPPLTGCPPMEFQRRKAEAPVLAEPPVLAVRKSKNSDFGPSWTSSDTHFNLLSEAQLWMYGISIIKKTSGDEAGIYLKDASGERYPMHMVDKQFRIWVGFAHDDKVEKAEFIVDGGCPHHIISDLDASRLRGGEGNLELVLGSFSKGQRHTLTGGDRWYVSLKNKDGEWRAPHTRITPTPGPVTDDELTLFLLDAQSCLGANRLEHTPRVMLASEDEKGGNADVGMVADDASEEEVTLTDDAPKTTVNGTGGSMKRTTESELARKLDATRELTRKMGYTKSDLDYLLHNNFISNKDVIPLESESSSEIADRLLAAGYQPGRTRSTRLRNKKERTELEPFHLVFCDGFEGFDEVGAHVTGHRYILRFVDYASGYR